MFARKGKSSDLLASVQRFTDMSRDSISRVKHLKNLLDNLTVHEKKQLVDDHSFETFHLVDELLLATDITNNSQGAIEAESGLWTLEQVLCLAPELVGSGWQQHAIESLLKKAIYPRNLLAVRKIAIRLFLIFYQSLSVYNKVTPDLDRVFQCLLPYFPLRNGDSTELVLQEYCQSAGTVQWSGNYQSVSSPVPGAGCVANAKERAQLLQVYLDKFLEYCSRESTRIEWNDETRRLQCAKFIVDRVIKFYIAECFPDMETNGVDIFGGWEGSGESGEPLDTADPVVIARYWLIRWMNNIVGARQQAGNVHEGMLLFHEALFSSQKATNTALTLMKEAMSLPLPCSNVILKVVGVLTNWLLQYEVPPFVASGEVTLESSSLLVTAMLMSFFHSPYLSQPGDRTSSAISITFAILKAVRELVVTRLRLPKPLTTRVWAELVTRLCESASIVCSSADKFGQETSSAFASTVLSSAVMIKAVRRLDVDDKIWDDVHSVFQKGIWIQMAQQWSKIAKSVTRAMILHLTHVDVFSNDEQDRTAPVPPVRRQRERGETASIGEVSVESVESGASSEDNVFPETDDITAAVISWSGDNNTWIQVWRRVYSILGPNSNANAILAVETFSQTIQLLLAVQLDSLAHWLADRLITAPPAVLPHCVAALGAVLNCPRPPPALLQAHILNAFQKLIQANDPQVLPQLSLLPPNALSILSPSLLTSIPKIAIGTPQMASHIFKTLALISTEHHQAEVLLLKQLSSAEMSLQHALMCTNALSLLVLQRGDRDLLAKVLLALHQHRYGPKLLPVFCSSLISLARFDQGGLVLQSILQAAAYLRDERARTEVEWMMTSLCLDKQHKELPLVLRGLIMDKQKLLEGALIRSAGQFPLPGFNVSQWNSLDSSNGKDPGQQVFVHRKNAIISVTKTPQCEVTSRTVVGRSCWHLEPLMNERRSPRNVNTWLRKEAQRGRKAGRESVGILGAMDDPFDSLPLVDSGAQEPPLDIGPWMQILESSRRQPQPLASPPRETSSQPSARLLEWRSFAASLGFVPSVANVPANFQRDLKHLDQTGAREVHKVAVIYVGKGQEDKQSILSNTTSSAEFERFVDELGWKVRIGRGHEGYAGGLPMDTVAPYYATADSELVFHVSTMLGGDVTHKWKHIGNDEVHIVWSDHWKPYKRDTIATKFCDVLIVLERASENTYRVRVDTTSALEFGPLYDGALIGEAELAEVVRLTVLNASRAYRMAREDHARPLRHREQVFTQDTMRHMKPVHLADAINMLYIPSMMSC